MCRSRGEPAGYGCVRRSSWAERKRATSKRGTHHGNYELPLPDGRVLYMRISHPVDRTDYGPSIWSHILRDQMLEVSAEEFRACVESIPVGVLKVLIAEAHIPESVVRAMTKAEAVQRLAEFYTTGQ